jgi:hypothetical protein
MMWFAGQVQVASGFGSTLRVEPVGVRAGNEFVVFFRMLDANQSSDGIGAQRFSINGNLMWGDTGVVLKPISNLQAYGSLTASYTNDGSFVAFTQSPSFGNDVIVAASIDQYGLPMWDTYFVNVATTPSSKSRAVATNADGGVVLAWQDDRSGANDIYGQRMNSDGSLGNSASCNADLDGDGNVGVSDLLQVIDAWGICGISCPEDIDSDGFVGVTDLLMMIDGWGDC